MKMKTRIKFNQPKYVIGALCYVGSLIVGALLFWAFDTEIAESSSGKLKTTEYLNADLPDANLRDDIGSKRANVQKTFGNIIDDTAISSIENDIDSIRKKEEYTSKYSEEELRMIEEQSAKDDEIKRLKEMNDRLQASARHGNEIGAMNENDYQLPLSEEDRARLAQMRRDGLLAELDRDLGNARQRGADRIGANTVETSDAVVDTIVVDVMGKPVRGLDEEAVASEVVKKVNASSSYFNTISGNEEQSNLIKAIVDEEIKVVDGSRVRLRILDDIEIDGVLVRKGGYMYATMSGFSQQRIQGAVKSVMVGDEIHKINLSVYDTDGLEGLYVPGSSFRETAQDVASSAMSSSMNMNTSGGNSVGQWAMQGVQQAYQRTSNAIAKAIKKNKVRIKYGTQVYLVNTKDKKNKNMR